MFQLEAAEAAAAALSAKQARAQQHLDALKQALEERTRQLEAAEAEVGIVHGSEARTLAC